MSMIKQAAQLLKSSSLTVALTGAGISVDSGVPDFRSPGGIWEKFDPMDYATIDSFNENPEKVWRMLRSLDGIVGKAMPNAGHVALAQLESMGYLHAVITQNIDNLHQRAGSKKVIEYHGNAAHLVCLSCGSRYGRDYALPFGDKAPRCKCGTILKPDVVFFGEPIPSIAMSESYAMASKCKLFLVIGTSATVHPAAGLPMIARERGADIIEFNLSRTGLSIYARMTILGSATETIPALVEAVKAIS